MGTKTQGETMYTELRKEYPRTWVIWNRMNYRCERSDIHTSYRDVVVCDSWNRNIAGEQGFINFFDDVGEIDTSGAYVERVNKYEDWTPQNTYTRPNKSGLQRWHDDHPEIMQGRAQGLNPKTIQSRLKKGWSVERATSEPLRQGKGKGTLHSGPWHYKG